MGCEHSKNVEVDEKRGKTVGTGGVGGGSSRTVGGGGGGEEEGDGGGGGGGEEVTPRNKDSKLMFTDIQIDVIRSTWPLLAKDMVNNGCRVFTDIFIAEPKVKQLFSFRNIDNKTLAQNDKFRFHAGKFMEALDNVCNDLENLSDDCPIGRRLMILGAEHATINGFDLYYFSVFVKCLHLTWEMVLREEYTDEVKDAWSCVFDYVITRIRDGYVIFQEEKERRGGGGGGGDSEVATDIKASTQVGNGTATTAH